MPSSSITHHTLRGPVPLIHLLLHRFIQADDRVVDATCGNGKDTQLLAELVGANGQVWAFDLQPEALRRTAERLAAHNLHHRVILLQAGHERLQELVSGPVQAIIFNLGWLPGASRQITTGSITTIMALEASLQLLGPAGLIFITCYPGHSGGDDEAAAVCDWCSQLPPRNYFVWRMGQLNVADKAPFCVVIQDSRTLNAN